MRSKCYNANSAMTVHSSNPNTSHSRRSWLNTLIWSLRILFAGPVICTSTAKAFDSFIGRRHQNTFTTTAGFIRNSSSVLKIKVPRNSGGNIFRMSIFHADIGATNFSTWKVSVLYIVLMSTGDGSALSVVLRSSLVKLYDGRFIWIGTTGAKPVCSHSALKQSAKITTQGHMSIARPPAISATVTIKMQPLSYNITMQCMMTENLKTVMRNWRTNIEGSVNKAVIGETTIADSLVDPTKAVSNNDAIKTVKDRDPTKPIRGGDIQQMASHTGLA